MRSQILIVLLAAVASARPVPTPHEHGATSPRELQYSDIAELSGAPEWRHGSKNYYGRDDEPPHHHHRDGPHFHGERDPHDHHHHGERHPHHPPHYSGSPRGDIVDNIIDFFSHQTRSLPEVSSRVMEGIAEFLSHETRSFSEEDDGVTHDEQDQAIIKKTLAFFTRAAK